MRRPCDDDSDRAGESALPTKAGEQGRPGSQQLFSNAESHRALVEDLKLKLATAHLGGSERSRARHVERGKLLPRDRVDSLVDASSPAPTTCDAAGELRPQARYVG